MGGVLLLDDQYVLLLASGIHYSLLMVDNRRSRIQALVRQSAIAVRKLKKRL